MDTVDSTVVLVNRKVATKHWQQYLWSSHQQQWWFIIQQIIAMTFTEISQTLCYQLVASTELYGNPELFVDINGFQSDTNNWLDWWDYIETPVIILE